jgi:heme/copper-type cytochrome/quinol oxidase subunit 3
MNIAVAFDEVEQQALSPASEAGPAPKRVVAAYGFWIFILSDIVMFSALFAAYAVLVHATAGGPTGAQLFNQVNVAIETACLLASSYTCSLMSLAINSRNRAGTYFFCACYLPARRGVSRSRTPRVHGHDRPRRRPAAQRFSFRLFHPCRLSRFAR